MFEKYHNTFSCVQAPQDTVEHVQKILCHGGIKKKRTMRYLAACAVIVILLGAVLIAASIADREWMFVSVYAEGQNPEVLDLTLNSSAISIHTETPKLVIENPLDSFLKVYNPITQKYEMAAHGYRENFFFQLQIMLKDPNTRLAVSYGNIELKEGEYSELLARSVIFQEMDSIIEAKAEEVKAHIKGLQYDDSLEKWKKQYRRISTGEI